ncbi:MAG TPA: hypothetical protein VE546_06405 [Streptomyces sp.]|uniref:hypothetical protein n=1 Tax=Streptomyces sp. TaxID=1931 RepID=UPI002D3977EF|nr:hypothetical protein [Streptomyces sp.]HZG03186.1 hypothetical protein [Streptomyces sp.]
MERTLLLRHRVPGTLVKLDRLLHERTGGMIGALSHQIRGAAIDAVLTGTEQITQDSPEAVPWSFDAGEKVPAPVQRSLNDFKSFI